MLYMSRTENRTPRTDGTSNEDTRTVDKRVGSCVARAMQPLIRGRYAHPATAPPPASRSHALLPGLLPSRPWGTSQRPFEGQPLSPPDPLRLTALLPSPSPRLSCSSMPFLQRYSADDLLDAAPRRYRRLGRVLGVAFGMPSRLGALLRALRAPALPDRCPIAALDAEALLPVARVGGRAALCAPLCLPTGQHWHTYPCQRWSTCLGRLVVRQEHSVSVL